MTRSPGWTTCAAQVSATLDGGHQAFTCGARTIAVTGISGDGVAVDASYVVAEIRIATPFVVPACTLLVTAAPDGVTEPSVGT